VRPRIFTPEKIELVARKIPTFKAMIQDMYEAEKAGACVWAADQLTVIWAELMQSFKAKNGGFIPINVWGDIRQMWNEYVTAFRNTKMHCIAIGRLGNVMEEQEGTKEGEVKLVKTGTTFKAGGSESFGYEPDWLAELSLERRPKKVRGTGDVREGEGRMIHRADVLKDRTWATNGLVMRWPDRGSYRPGGYRTVWNDIKPYFDAVQQTQEHSQLEEGTSEEAIQDDGRGDYYHRSRMKQACLEDWDAGMEMMFPGSAALMKRNRALVGEAISGVRSRTRLEQYDVSQLQQCVGILMALEHRLKAEPAATEDDLLRQVEAAKEVFRGKPQVTLLEARLRQSVERANGKPQPVVAVMDKPVKDEVGAD
jgi:hypothetical protein